MLAFCFLFLFSSIPPVTQSQETPEIVIQLGIFEKIQEKDYKVIKRPERSEVDILVRVQERED